VDEISLQSSSQRLAYFYCNRNEESRREPGNVLRSFVKQLSISPDSLEIQDALVGKYTAKRQSGFSSNQLTDSEVESLLEELMQAYSKTILVLDALDECNSKTRSALIETFDRLIKVNPTLKIFISSRRDDDIQYRLNQKVNLGIEATDNGKDIQKFVCTRLDENQWRRRRPLSEGLRKEIIEIIFYKSDGM
jgi:Cdc6-like AAA superfamily ATPase